MFYEKQFEGDEAKVADCVLRQMSLTFSFGKLLRNNCTASFSQSALSLENRRRRIPRIGRFFAGLISSPLLIAIRSLRTEIHNFCFSRSPSARSNTKVGIEVVITLNRRAADPSFPRESRTICFPTSFTHC